MRAAVAVGLLFFLAAQLIPGQLMKIFTGDADVIREGISYLRIVSFSYVFMGITQTYLYIMRSVERVVVATVVYLCSLLCNIMINAVLIFGLFGMPALGVRGAAIGTLVSRLLEMLLVCLYSHFGIKRSNSGSVILEDRKSADDGFPEVCVPGCIKRSALGMGTAANTAILGHMGSSAVAANSVAQVARQLATVVTFGVSSAAAIYLGKTIGEKKMEHAKAYAHKFLVLSLLLGIAGGVVILTISPAVISLMALTPTAKEYLQFMFFVMSYFVIGQAVNTTLVVGVFRSGGDTRFGLILDMSTMWGCSILFGFLAAFVFHWSVPVVYMILMSDEIIKIPITLYRYRGYKWLKDVTRDAAGQRM